jgi:hypothetical protein
MIDLAHSLILKHFTYTLPGTAQSVLLGDDRYALANLRERRDLQPVAV